METNNINNEKKVANAPLLRFPEFKDEWGKTTLENICGELEYGMNAPAKTFDGENKYIRITDIDESTNKYVDENPVSPDGVLDERYLVKNNDILFARTGASTGKTYLYSSDDGKLYFAGFLIRANVKSSNDSRFIFYNTQLPRYKKWVSITSQRSGQPGINSQEYGSFEIFKPNIEEQKKIADFISLLDKRIELQKSVIEKLKSLKSAIRDKIYSSIIKSGETNCRFCDVLNYEQPNKYIVSNTEYSNNSALIPVLTANQAFILGYTEEKSGIYEKGQCIIIDDFTLDCKYVDFNFKVKSSAIKILTAKDNYRLRFLYEYIRFLNLSTTEHKRHYISEIEPMEICMPDENTIIKVASLMKNIDKKAESENRFLKNLINQKNYLLSKMFI